ncbi:helix-turn-helix domain-containing protein [Paenibacillus alvei]|uniref:helix-turn-helix domain-containing protein n=1 Tax=Paenibacillus alvei TaxID=44250 RepID=UPI0013DB23C7|nr:helix-turn-helix transcriptional regulator [Paenibacillus alvei]
MNVGDRIKELRMKKKLTQSEMAKKIGTGRANYAHMENNRVEIKHEFLQAIANELEVSTDYLLGNSISKQSDVHDLKKFLNQHQILFDGVPLTEEDIARIKGYLDALLTKGGR